MGTHLPRKLDLLLHWALEECLARLCQRKTDHGRSKRKLPGNRYYGWDGIPIQAVLLMRQSPTKEVLLRYILDTCLQGELGSLPCAAVQDYYSI